LLFVCKVGTDSVSGEICGCQFQVMKIKSKN
jgi:hypothetical protein